MEDALTIENTFAVIWQRAGVDSVVVLHVDGYKSHNANETS